MEWLGWTVPSSFCLSGSLVSVTCIWRVLGLGLGHSLAAGPCGGGFSGSERGGEMGGTDCYRDGTHCGGDRGGGCHCSGCRGETDGGGVSISRGEGRERDES